MGRAKGRATGRASSEQRAVEWQERIGRWRRSGLPVAEFTRREQVSQPSFYAWRKRLGQQGGLPSGRPLFVPVEMGSADSSPGGVQIDLPGGAVVTLPAAASAALVTTAIRAAMSTASASAAEGASC